MTDPYFSCGLFDVHIDGNCHDASELNRRINALVYLSPNWRAEWGGKFGMFDETGDKCIKAVAPLFNRLVIFDSHDKSFHGLPSPVKFPQNDPRRSIILYYYTVASRPDHLVTEASLTVLFGRDEIFLINGAIRYVNIIDFSHLPYGDK